jgi:hypothetical protein
VDQTVRTRPARVGRRYGPSGADSGSTYSCGTLSTARYAVTKGRIAKRILVAHAICECSEPPAAPHWPRGGPVKGWETSRSDGVPKRRNALVKAPIGGIPAGHPIVPKRFPGPRAEVRFLPGARPETPGQRAFSNSFDPALEPSGPVLVPRRTRGRSSVGHVCGCRPPAPGTACSGPRHPLRTKVKFAWTATSALKRSGRFGSNRVGVQAQVGVVITFRAVIAAISAT